jgi:hypothetical protein
MQSGESYKSFHLCDVEFGLCLCERWSPIHRDDLALVRIDVVVLARLEW